MRFSNRVQSLRESSTLAVTARAAALRASGVDVIGLGAGEPDFGTPEPIRAAAIKALESGMTRYVATPGTPTARSAIADALRRRNGLSCSADDVVITVGAKHAIYMALQCLLDPAQGHEVILPTPAWVSYRPLIELAGGRCIEVPMSMESGFRLDPAHLDAAIGPKTVAVLLNSPSNPCGVAWPPDQVRAIADVIAPHTHVTVISDEIYERLIYPERDPKAEHLSIGSLPSVADRTVTVNGLSKAYAMTGWRIGYLAAPPGSGLAAQVAKLEGQMTNNITAFTYPAIVEALNNGDEAVERMRAIFAHRASLVVDVVSHIPGFELVPPNAAFYAFPRIRQHLGCTSPAGRPMPTAEAFCTALLEEAGVALVPGEDFGECAADHVRLSFACSEEMLVEAGQRIRTFVEAIDRPTNPVDADAAGAASPHR